MSWQPIETAPRDKTEILLGWTSGLVLCGYWSQFRNHLGWTTSRGMYGDPTHWMPLPEPPHE